MPDATMTSQIKDSISDAGAAVRETLHTGRLSAADALHNASKGLHSKADRLGQAGHDAADKVEDTSRYVRTHGAGKIMADVESFVKRNPGKSLIAAAIVGFLAARVLRRSD